jgi:hypothetical protein
MRSNMGAARYRSPACAGGLAGRILGRVSWQIRVAAALLLASLLRMSDGDAFWADLLPTLITAAAVATAAAMVLRARLARR